MKTNSLLLLITLLSILTGSVNAQYYTQYDTLRSQAFKSNQTRRTYFKAKYPSYSLLAGYLLVTEANRGDPFAQHELGLRYLLGQGFPPDTVKAIYWIRKAVDQNLPVAKFNYGILLYNGIGVPWNPFEAYLNFKSAANAGLPEAEFAYGLMLVDNLIVNKNYNKAYQLFQSSAKKGYLPAKEAIEQMKKSGFTFYEDTTQTKSQTVEVNEDSRLISSEWDLEYYNFDDDSTKEENVDISKLLDGKVKDLKKYFGIDEAKENLNLADTTGKGILLFAAENGSPEAIYVIGLCYEKGFMFEKNLIKASTNYLHAYRLGSYKAGERLFKMIADENFGNVLKENVNRKNTDAMYVTAGLAALGLLNLISDQEALELLKNAALQNHLLSIIELGLCYSSGSLVKKDLKKAIEYWEIARRLSSKEALIRIAFAQIVDTTFRNNVEEQINILKNAAEEGSVLAETYLGYCYEKGIGVKEEKGIAAKLYRRAAQRGNQTAFNSLKKMYDELRPSDEEFQLLDVD
ncbi:tetratricopeptide repeat protein [Rosettibacter firmus]|uniref:tetratricopeptide repeat protein n=1 Tax=Rosettibacter firmus TaxID=3111522 RepID=UPI00336C0AF9